MNRQSGVSWHIITNGDTKHRADYMHDCVVYDFKKKSYTYVVFTVEFLNKQHGMFTSDEAKRVGGAIRSAWMRCIYARPASCTATALRVRTSTVCRRRAHAVHVRGHRSFGGVDCAETNAYRSRKSCQIRSPKEYVVRWWDQMSPTECRLCATSCISQRLSKMSEM